MSKHRNFVFCRCLDQDDTHFLNTIDCKYIVYTQNFDCLGSCVVQGVVVFTCQRTLSSVMKSMPGYDVNTVIEVQNALDECKQTNYFSERGIAPLSNKQKVRNVLSFGI